MSNPISRLHSRYADTLYAFNEDPTGRFVMRLIGTWVLLFSLAQLIITTTLLLTRVPMSDHQQVAVAGQGAADKTFWGAYRELWVGGKPVRCYGGHSWLLEEASQLVVYDVDEPQRCRPVYVKNELSLHQTDALILGTEGVLLGFTTWTARRRNAIDKNALWVIAEYITPLWFLFGIVWSLRFGVPPSGVPLGPLAILGHLIGG